MTAASVQVRGPNYLRDKKKILAHEPLFALAAVDLVECETGTFHIAQYLPSLKCGPTPQNNSNASHPLSCKLQPRLYLGLGSFSHCLLEAGTRAGRIQRGRRP